MWAVSTHGGGFNPSRGPWAACSARRQGSNGRRAESNDVVLLPHLLDLERGGLVDLVDPVRHEEMAVRAPAVERCLRRIVAREVVVRQLDRHVGADVAGIFVA